MSASLPVWKTGPINRTCEVLMHINPEQFCDKPTVAARPFQLGGWFALCDKHAAVSRFPTTSVDKLIEQGEKWL